MSSQHQTDKILNKIKKCLALAKSSNPNEAAAALRQAQKLMQQHGITDQDVELSDVQELKFKAGAAENPPQWLTMLISTVSTAFGVRPIFSSGLSGWSSSHVVFIGVGSQPEIAGYAYEVLFRQVKRDRSDHVKKQNNRCKPSTKTRRGDLFAEAWVHGVRQTVTAFAMPERHEELIGKYMQVKHKNLSTLKPRSAEAKRNDYQSQNEGYQAGKAASLNRGMNETARPRLSGD